MYLIAVWASDMFIQLTTAQTQLVVDSRRFGILEWIDVWIKIWDI